MLRVYQIDFTSNRLSAIFLYNTFLIINFLKILNLIKDAGYTKDDFGCNLPTCECAEPTSLTFGDIDLSWNNAPAFINYQKPAQTQANGQYSSFIALMTNPWDQHRDQNTGKYIIAYTIDRGFNTGQISPILAAIKTIEDVSCIKFELLTQQKVPHPQSIFFSKSNEYSKLLNNFRGCK